MLNHATCILLGSAAYMLNHAVIILLGSATCTLDQAGYSLLGSMHAARTLAHVVMKHLYT